MPVKVDRKFLLDVNGQTVVLAQEEMQAAKTETVVTITCNGPRCQARNRRPEPFSLTWVEEEVAKDPLKLPDAFFTMIKMAVDPVKPQELVFCGRQCVNDYLTYTYVPPQPPRIALENAKLEQAKKLEQLNPHLIAGDAKAEYHTTQKPPVTLPPHSGDTLKVVQEPYNLSPEDEKKLYEAGLRAGEESAKKRKFGQPIHSDVIVLPDKQVIEQILSAQSPEPQADGYVDHEADVHV